MFAVKTDISKMQCLLLKLTYRRCNVCC